MVQCGHWRANEASFATEGVPPKGGIFGAEDLATVRGTVNGGGKKASETEETDKATEWGKQCLAHPRQPGPVEWAFGVWLGPAL